MKLKKKGIKKMKTIQRLYNDIDNLRLEDLAEIRRELKSEIEVQQVQLLKSAKRLVPFTKDSTTFSFKNRFSPLSLITTPLRKGKTFSLVEGIVMGYKVMRNVRRIFKR